VTEANRRINALRMRARLETLVVLVWGHGDPGPGGSETSKKYWNKRNQIRDEIQKQFPNSEVLFSESSPLRRGTNDLNDLLDEELVHAKIADCIIILDVSRGAHVEVDRFTSIPDIARKMTVLIPEQFVGNTGLVSHVHKHARVQGFSDIELDSCTVATLKSISIVDTAAINKLIGPNLS